MPAALPATETRGRKSTRGIAAAAFRLRLALGAVRKADRPASAVWSGRFATRRAHAALVRHACPRSRAQVPTREPSPRACPRAAAVRSPARHCEAGNRAWRFIAASSVRVISRSQTPRIGTAVHAYAGRRANWALLAAGADGHEPTRDFPPGGAGRRPRTSPRRRRDSNRKVALSRHVARRRQRHAVFWRTTRSTSQLSTCRSART